jgi:epoxide hydrolase-like predicted phosphatase
VIKTIIFDFGGVLYNTPNRTSLSRWGKMFGFNDHPEFAAMIENPHESSLVRDICLGVISEREMWRQMAEKWHIKPGVLRYLRQQMNSKRRLNQPLVKLLADLQIDYQTAILSNAGDDSRELMERSLQLDRFVDEIIISAEEGLIKPDPRIYQLAIDRLDTSPAATLFIDDLQENIDAARGLGMQSVHHTDNEKTIRDIDEILRAERL